MSSLKKLEGKKAIFFDYGGTLDAPGIAWKEHFYEIYKRHGISVDMERFSRAFYAADDSLILENPISLNLTQIVHEQVKRVLKGLDSFSENLQGTIAKEFLSNSFKDLKKSIECLKRLRTRFRIGIISNNYGNLEAICRETGLIDVVDIMLDSNLIGAMKPDKKIFLKGLNALDVSPKEAVMVGDNIKRDILGAKAIGMDAILISSERSQDIKVPEGTLVISDMVALLRLAGLRS